MWLALASGATVKKNPWSGPGNMEILYVYDF